MITEVFHKVYLPPHLHYLSDKLSRKIQDDVQMYDILALSKETLLFYFLESNETSGGVGFFTDINMPDSIFTSGTLIATVQVHHDNYEAIHSRVFITLPFAEKEEQISFQNPPRKTKYPIVSKSILQKGISDLNKLGINKFVDVNKIGYELFDKYNNINLIDDVIAVDDKRQQQIDMKIKKRSQEHQHTQLYYNKIKLPPIVEKIPQNQKSALFALHWFDHGGAEKFALMSMKKAYDMGFKVYCVIDKRGNKHYEQQAQDICEYIFNIADGLPVEYWQRFYVNLCNKLHIQLLHIHHAISAYQALPKIKSLTTINTVLDTTHIIEHVDGGYARISGVFSQYLDYHHTISQELNDYLANELLVPYHKIKLGYLFNKNKELNFEYSKFDYLQEKCIISFVGRLVNQKRPYLFIELVKEIINNPKLKDKNICFNMVGEGPLWQSCEELIAKYHLDEKINILPANHNVHELLTESHFLIIPSENEGLTLVAYEAILNNSIVISTDVGSQREVVASEALFSRYPKKFINSCVELLIKSFDDIQYTQHLLNEQKRKINDIMAQNSWEEVLEKIYGDAKNV